MDDILVTLRSLTIFKQLSDDDLQELAGLIEHRQLATGDVLFHQGDPGDALFIVRRGQLMVRVVDVRGVEKVVAYLQPGDHLGETSLLTGEEHDATVQALEQAEMLVLPKAKFDRLLASRPHIRGLLQVKEKTREKLAARAFPDQAEGEVPLVFKRKHWIVLIGNLRLPALGLLLALPALLALIWITRRLELSTIPVMVAGSLLILVLTLWTAWQVVDWVNDHYIVTNKRVIHIEKILFFYEERREAPLSSVQNVNVVTRGPLASLLNYDDLIVETAGEAGNIVFATIPNARQVREVIFEQIRRVQALTGVGERRRVVEDIREQLQRAMERTGAARPGAQPRREEKNPELKPAQKEAPQAQQPTTERRESAITRAILAIFPPMWDEGEDRITWRKHWFILLRKAWAPLLSCLSLLALLLVVLTHRPHPALDLLSRRVESAILMPFLLAAGFWLWFRLEDWKNDIYVITDNALLDIEKRPLRLREESKKASLGVVQDVSYTVPHPIAELFNFGHVYIETAGPTGRLTFHWVSNPRGVQREIFRRMEAFQARQRQQEAARRREELVQWFGLYHGLANEPGGDEEPV